MCPDEKNPGASDAQLESLVAAAEETRARRRTAQKTLDVKDAENTLNSLLEAADEAELARGRPRVRRNTQTAMEDLFSEQPEASASGAGVLVGLEDLGGVEGSIDESVDEEATLAGAEDAEKRRKPVRKLDDGIDFWNELETIDRDPDAEG